MHSVVEKRNKNKHATLYKVFPSLFVKTIQLPPRPVSLEDLEGAGQQHCGAVGEACHVRCQHRYSTAAVASCSASRQPPANGLGE